MRQLLISEIKPIISYACAAWFMYRTPDAKKDGKSNLYLRKNVVAVLKKLQYACLMQISGAFQSTPGNFLHRELQIQPVEIWLAETSAIRQAQKYPGILSSLHKLRAGLPKDEKQQYSNPMYHFILQAEKDYEDAAKAYRDAKKKTLIAV